MTGSTKFKNSLFIGIASCCRFGFLIALLGYFSEVHASLNTNVIHSKSYHSRLTNQENNSKVLSIYRQWAGTRYRLGGTTKAGIDCSAFVKTTMSSAYNLHLPRSTAEQKSSGKAISKNQLRPGDLIFFRQNHHVGVYIGGGKFIHSSSSRGVTTSSLSERYWSKTYTQSRRVL